MDGFYKLEIYVLPRTTPLSKIPNLSNEANLPVSMIRTCFIAMSHICLLKHIKLSTRFDPKDGLDLMLVPCTSFNVIEPDTLMVIAQVVEYVILYHFALRI
jgi:hypothetical protein